MTGFDQWFYSAPHRHKYPRDSPAYLAAAEAWQEAPALALEHEAELIQQAPQRTARFKMQTMRTLAAILRERAREYRDGRL